MYDGMTYQLKELERTILKILSEEEETYGYNLWKRLSSKGFKFQSNHLYVTLKEMERKGLLKGRWEMNENVSNGLRIHLYSIDKKGVEAVNSNLADALNLLMTSYVNFMRKIEDFSGFSKVIIQASKAMQMPIPSKGMRIVLSVPYHDPLTCYQLIFSLSDAFPESLLYVITPPNMELYESRPNITVLHGWRYDIPLKDEFADYLILEGFPKQVPEEKTIIECTRVLKYNGNFIAQVKNTMVEEKRPQYPFFSEYVEKLFYELFQQDREINQKHLGFLLSSYFGNMREAELSGTTLFYCSKKQMS